MSEKIFGTVDMIIIKGTHMDVVDWKFGRGEIDDADINIQGQAYLLGAWDKFPDVETATIHFVIPRRDEVLRHNYTREDLEQIRLRIKVIVGKATSDTVDLRPNTEGCRYCKHQLTCEALSNKILPVARKYASTIQDFELEVMKKYDPALIEDPSTLAQMLNIGQVIDKWSSAARKQAMKLAEEEGVEIPGYDLRWRQPSAKVQDPQAAYEALADVLTPEEFMKASSVSLSQLAKIYAEKMPRGQKTGARGQLELILEEAGELAPEEERIRTPYLKKL
tara:strand:+ start:2223 stop:3056 length:834 start_codon:yes stop_codon:yes gene_type:complete